MEELRKDLEYLIESFMAVINQACQVRVEYNECIVDHCSLSDYEAGLVWLAKKGLAEKMKGREYRLRFDKIKECVEQQLSKQAIDWKKLREEYFTECVGMGKVSFAPHDMFEWFKRKLSEKQIESNQETEEEFKKFIMEYADKKKPYGTFRQMAEVMCDKIFSHYTLIPKGNK